jgi:uncharacterized membrane protein YkvA (DUF1232 family)
MTRARKKLTKRQWRWLIFGFCYLLMPADIIPDFCPVVGNADDAAVMVFVIKKILAEEESK